MGQTEALRPRKCVEVDVEQTGAGASTPGNQMWKVVVNHTRHGSALGAKVPAGKRGRRFKADVLENVITRATASASTPGIVLGDLNLTTEQVNDVAQTYRGGHVETIDVAGGTGGAVRVAG